MHDVLISAQGGLLMRAFFGQVLTLHLKNHDVSTYERIHRVINDLANKADEGKNCGLVVGFGTKAWKNWKNRIIHFETAVLDKGVKFKNTGGDILLYLKTPDHTTAEDLLAGPKKALDDVAQIDTVVVGKRRDARIMGGRYIDSITNPNDPNSLEEDVLVSGGHPVARQGSCFALTQKLKFDWESILDNTATSQNQTIGRRTDGSILSQHAQHGHIHRANVRDSNKDQRKLLRQALPYGTSGDHSGREEGSMFIAFCNDQQRFEDILANLLGKELGKEKNIPTDRLIQMVESQGGGYWYVPAAAELGIPSVHGAQDVYEDPHWKVRSKNNEYLFYNSQDYLHRMGINKYKGGDPPSTRLLSLMNRTFNHWRDGWVHRQRVPRLPHLSEKYPEDWKKWKNSPVPIRKGIANFKTLTDILSSRESKIADESGLLRIYSKELIVGVIPDFTFGRGKEVIRYLQDDEEMRFWLKYHLNEFSAMGHVVPDFGFLVRHGLANIIQDLENKREQDQSRATFYNSAIKSLKGVQGYLKNWAELCRIRAAEENCADSENMREVCARLEWLTNRPPESFKDAVQLIYSFHCCLHLVGELTPFGRLDQILLPFYQNDPSESREKDAQDVIDCLFVKIGENAFVDRAFIQDYVTYGTTSVNGKGGNFPQGGGINQWCQQITVGGYKFADGNPQDASNELTMLFLSAAKRIPVNAPTLSLRVHKDTPKEYLNEAAKAILSGGAQPILYNDDKLCEALFQSGTKPGSMTRAWSRNYAADGCYEPMLAGASDFSFNNVAPMLALEQSLNEGATYGAAGPEQLRGLKQTFRSPPVDEIKTWEALLQTFNKQLEWLTVECYDFLLQNHGNLAEVCPSPLLSVLIDGCIESGLDHTNGGSRFHIIAPLFVGVTNTIDSLYAIYKLVFDPETACTTLSELALCLFNDWGFTMIEPYQDQLLGATDATAHAQRFKELRDRALALPKWGSGDEDEKLKTIGEDLLKQIVNLGMNVIRQPHPALEDGLDKIKRRYGDKFAFTVTPGIGTFEGYVGDGMPCGASADGRRNGMPIASDLSPVPAPQDLPAMPAFRNIYQSMQSYKNENLEYGLSDAAPVDMNIPEDFPLEELETFIEDYAKGKVGGNLITLTCADLDTYKAASKDPEKYNLVRVRMGGWTEFYSTMFPAHQDQHQRRQYFVADSQIERSSNDPGS